MKLLLCIDCNDIFSLSAVEKKCHCGKTSGRYVDSLNAEITGNCKAIGFSNSSFIKACQMQLKEDKVQSGIPSCCEGIRFEAFFIPESATSIKRK